VPYEQVIALRDEAFRLGLETGELKGRQALALELEQCFSQDGRHPFTLEDAKRVKARQVH
jgi:hypothetical protein